jgi:hypothetical protein
MSDISLRMDLLNAEIRIKELERNEKELIQEFAEAECMGDLAKIARNHGYDDKAGDL